MDYVVNPMLKAYYDDWGVSGPGMSTRDRFLILEQPILSTYVHTPSDVEHYSVDWKRTEIENWRIFDNVCNAFNSLGPSDAYMRH